MCTTRGVGFPARMIRELNLLDFDSFSTVDFADGYRRPATGALLFRETDFTFARVGISMNGHRPSRETRLSWTLEHKGGGL